MVPLAGIPLLVRQINTVRGVGIEEITVVTGYCADLVERLGVPTRHNPDFETTNMVHSLMCAADLLDGGDDVLITYADLVYEPRVVEALLGCSKPISTTVDLRWKELWGMRLEDPRTDAETLRLDADANITELGGIPRSLEEAEGRFMGLIKVRGDFAPQLVQFHEALDRDRPLDRQPVNTMYMTTFLQALIDAGFPVRAVPVKGGWLEIDTTADLELFERLEHQGRLARFCALKPKG